MSASSPGARAVSSLEIEDVFLIDSHCFVSREFNQTMHFPEVTYGFSAGVDPQVMTQTRTPVGAGDAIHLVRYFVNAEVRLVRPGTKLEEGSEPSQDDFLAILKFTLAADYRCPDASLQDEAAISAFSKNAYFHAWPYVREETHAMCARLRLPRITLPMHKPNPPPKLAGTPSTDESSR